MASNGHDPTAPLLNSARHSYGGATLAASSLQRPGPSRRPRDQFNEIFENVARCEASPLNIVVYLSFFVGFSLLGLAAMFLLLGNRLHRPYAIDPSYLLDTLPTASSLEANLRSLTRQPHLAGKSQELAKWMEARFKSFGLETETKVYYPYLNYPKASRVAIYEPRELAYEAKLREDIVPEDETSRDQDATPAFHGLSADGEATAQIVYVNYGTEKDFELLASHNVSVHGKIALARYGKVLRGLKVQSAEKRGAVGVLIYSDPQEDGFVKGKVYPEGPFRPGSGIQRGSVQFTSIYPGDPLTPGYAATKDADRIRLEHVKSLPKIPSLPLSYDDAYPLLKALSGNGIQAYRLGDRWQGGLNISYWSGPSQAKVHMVNRVIGEIKPIYNVIATISGEEEADREIILGNHRDAWVFGAVDPGAGTATFLEIARVLGEAKRRGWRPRRTLKFCSWDAEEYGLIGSTEYVEDHAEYLSNKAVAYINVDMFEGESLRAGGSLLLQDLFERVAKSIVDPSNANQSLHDNWATQPRGPHLKPLGTGSDFTPFSQHVGIASLDLSFKKDSGIYHSNYDSFNYMKKLGDPGFVHHLAMTQLWGKIAVELVDSSILPFNATRYGHELENHAKEVQANLQKLPSSHGIDFGDVMASTKNITSAAIILHSEAESLISSFNFSSVKPRQDCSRDSNRCFGQLRSINDRLAFFERKLIDKKGIPSRPWYKHIVYAPGLWKGYNVQTFPAFQEAVDSSDWHGANNIANGYAEILQKAAIFLS